MGAPGCRLAGPALALARTHEVARHAVHEVGLDAVEVVQIAARQQRGVIAGGASAEYRWSNNGAGLPLNSGT
jgi:hypothetical protein